MVRQDTIETQMSTEEDQHEVESKTVVVHPGTVDWGPSAKPNSHIFMISSSGEEPCHLGNSCQNSKGVRMKCSVCKIAAHDGCQGRVHKQTPCRPTFSTDIRTYRENGNVAHHWITLKKIKGKCRHCSKSFQSKAAGMTCSWCKLAYHTSDSCQEALDKDDVCGLGIHASLIVPPNWIIKLPKKGYIDSSLNLDKEDRREKTEYEKIFILKPVPISNCHPLVVFLNPKSGGNQGIKLLQRFQALLNPRQVFDITQGGPGRAIEMFKKVPGVRFLACGGDGTAGWVLSVLDKIKVEPTPPVGVLPLGTGNDLSRSLGWGGGYIDESISDILIGLQSAEVIAMDRWRLHTTPNKEIPPTDKGVDMPPLNVVNNYFSMGVDALIALQFHEAREANPEKFNSRIKNKMYYGQAGGKDLLVAKWKKLSEYVTLECDGQDMTAKLKELKIHSILFLNISCFGSGTRPWNRQHGVQKLDDGIIEVIGLTTYQLPLLQAGGHGQCITQCKTAKITTTKTIPVQVDGEAVRLNPCTIEISLLNKAKMLTKKKNKRGSGTLDNDEEDLTVEVCVVTMDVYEKEFLNREKMIECAESVGRITADPGTNLNKIRAMIIKLEEKMSSEQGLGNDWDFVDCISARNAFRIVKSDESNYFLIDICHDKLLIVASKMSQDISSKTPLAKKDEAILEKPQTPQICIEEATNFHLTVPFLREGCSILEKTSEGVLKAARLGDLELMKSLHQDGYSLLSIDETAKTALHYGARFGHKEIIRYLLQKGPQCIVDMTDNEKGQTALHKAAVYRRRDICCMLIAAGASLLITDKEGKTPCQRVDKEDTELIAYLESQQQFQEVAMQDLETIL